jgi:hypothetical protein
LALNGFIEEQLSERGRSPDGIQKSDVDLNKVIASLHLNLVAHLDVTRWFNAVAVDVNTTEFNRLSS